MIAVNSQYLNAPFADVLYFADSRWWWRHKDKPQFKRFAGVKVTIEPTGLEITDPHVHMLRSADDKPGAPKPGLSANPAVLVTGRNGGYQVVNIAVLAGAKKIVLLGYDMRIVGGKSHNEMNHPGGRHPEGNAASDYVGYVKNFRTMVRPLERLGVEVLNATPESALDVFRKVPLEIALA